MHTFVLFIFYFIYLFILFTFFFFFFFFFFWGGGGGSVVKHKGNDRLDILTQAKSDILCSYIPEQVFEFVLSIFNQILLSSKFNDHKIFVHNFNHEFIVI